MARRFLIIDVIVTVVYLLVANPFITGLAVHEWLSLGCIVVFIVHCAVHYDWFLATIRGRVGKASAAGGRQTGGASTGRSAGRSGVAHLVLDSATLIVFMVVTVSGLMVSRHILPALGLVAPGYFFWNQLHSISAKVLLALLLVHVVMHVPWLLGAIKAKARKRP